MSNFFQKYNRMFVELMHQLHVAQDVPPPNPKDGFEKDVLSFGPVLGLAGVLVFLIVFSAIVGYLFFRYLPRPNDYRKMSAQRMASADRIPPEPRLQIDESKDMAQLRQDEMDLIGGYHWVDRATGKVRIPIERAIELTAQEGLPVRAKSEAKQ